MAEIRISLLATLLIGISFVDARKRIIPNCLTLSLLVVQVVYTALASSGIEEFAAVIGKSLIWAFAVFSVLALACLLSRAVTRRNGLGGGDIKLIAAFGFVLGPMGAMASTLIACIGALTYSFFKRLALTDGIPFGPFLAAGAIILLLCGC